MNNQFENISNEALMRDYEETGAAGAKEADFSKKRDIFDYQASIENELNKRGLYLDCNGNYWDETGCMDGVNDFDYTDEDAEIDREIFDAENDIDDAF